MEAAHKELVVLRVSKSAPGHGLRRGDPFPVRTMQCVRWPERTYVGHR